MIYTGIGSRETPRDILMHMSMLGVELAKLGWTLRSGHAEGADKAFEQGAIRAKGKMEIYLPWENFNEAPTNDDRYMTVIHPEALDIARNAHPAWDRCSPGSRKMHVRNVHQVLGVNLDTPNKLIICWTSGGRRGGGTGQALRIAEKYQIPIIDLAVDSTDTLENLVVDIMAKQLNVS